MRFNELVRLLEQNGFRLIREKGSIRYYSKPGVPNTWPKDYPDYDNEGKLAGIEILDVIKRFGDKETLRQVVIEGLGPSQAS